jgi:hypothetical protein
MSRTRKDSRQGTVIEIVRREDGAYDLFLNRRLDHERIHEDGLGDVLCVRFGYCGDEFKAILSELIQNGRAERHPN